MENIPRGDNCNIDVDTASFDETLRSEKHPKNIRQ